MPEIPSRTRIEYRSFVCPDGHEFRCACKLLLAADGKMEEFFAPNSILGGPGKYGWLPIPKCPAPDCLGIGDEQSDVRASYSPAAQVPESQRFYAWLAPDGSSISVPGYHGAKMPARYVHAGYIPVEAHNLRDLDRFERIRERQTGNHVYNEMNFDPATRKERQEAEYSDDPTVDV